MKRSLPLWSLALLLCAAGAHAQLYKWVGPDGKIVYSDTPPPSSVTQVERKSISTGGADVELPYELAEASKNSPVTLYTMKNCEPCNDGRKYLTDRGIPFAEKTVISNADVTKLKQVGGGTQLPLLLVGRSKSQGFEQGAWDSALTTAGYPNSSQLPKNYRYPSPEPAAPEPTKVASPGTSAGNGAAAPAAPSSTELPPATGKAPPGFRF